MPKKPDLSRRDFLELAVAGGLATAVSPADEEGSSPTSLGAPEGPHGWWPQPYSVKRDEEAGKLVLSTRYYTVEHDLKKGGAITRIRYTYGQAENLLLQPIGAWVRLKEETPPGHSERRSRRAIFSDLNDASPAVTVGKSGKAELVSVEASLLDSKGREAGIKTKTTYAYRWGYIKIHKEFLFPGTGLKLRGMSVISTQFHPSLTHYS